MIVVYRNNRNNRNYIGMHRFCSHQVVSSRRASASAPLRQPYNDASSKTWR